FSSRRRHTRSKRDWSSDVCSSDLNNLINIDQIIIVKHPSATLKANIINRLIQTFQTTYDLEILCSTLGNDYVDGVIIRDKQTAEIGRASCRERIERWEGEGERRGQ